MEDFWDFVKIIGTTLIGILIFLALFAATGMYFFDRPSCHARWAQNDPQWGFYSGCTIVVRGQRIPDSAYRNADIGER